MRIGCAVPVSSARLAREIGFDFVELRVAELHPGEPDTRFLETERTLESAGIPAETFSFLLPAGLKVVGPSVDLAQLRTWVAAAAKRARSLGGRLIVVGSGDARRVPVGFPMAQAESQFVAFLAAAAEQADRHGIVLALEALNRTETNLLHSFSEACSIAASLDHPAVGVVADIYHMRLEDEPLHHLADAGARLLHVQLADSGRLPPGQGCFDFQSVFTFLNSIGYAGSVALECSFQRFSEEGVAALAYVRRVSTTIGSLAFAP